MGTKNICTTWTTSLSTCSYAGPSRLFF